MIEYVRGILTEKELSQVAVEAHGVGYEVLIPLSTYERLPAPGAEVKLYTHFHVREDTQKLFGFFSKDEREVFRQLIAVSSIGPKTAMSILSKVSVDDLIRSITLGDPSLLGKIPGVGVKTVERLIMELRGKLKVAPGAADTKEKGASTPAGKKILVNQEAFSALVSLGYGEKQVQTAIERVRQTIADKDAPVEEWIKKALQVI
jgi:Holliday junction DNA helicase RuvA